ncbi:MAG: recombinase RecT [Treponema sp.]|nr:recombinase RecT [Treponema sp.]
MAENEIVQFNPVSLMPRTFNEKYQMSQVLAKSGLIPAGLNTPEKVCVALEWGHELQLSPMVAVNNIAVINGKPTLSADIMAAVVKRSPEFGGIKWIQQDDKVAECIITRKTANYTEETHSRFTYDDAMQAGLTNKDVWKKYTKRMLKHRCLSYGLRDAFPDILAGLYSPEEMESVIKTDTERNITSEATATVLHETVTENQQQAPKDEMSEAVQFLSRITTEYKRNLAGQPYQLAMEALRSNDINQIRAMTKRVIDYLGRQGIEVA